MNPEPPSETGHKQDEGVDAETHEPSGNGRRGRWSSITAVVGVLLVAGGIAAFLFLSSEPDPRDERAAPAQGLSCPHLRRAADAYERGDRAAFNQEIARAAAIAEETLETSGQAFGEPERIALELELGSDQRIPRLLDRVQSVCSAPSQ